MGRSAKIVRTPAFEKQKRHEKGQDWKKSQWKQARDLERPTSALWTQEKMRRRRETLKEMMATRRWTRLSSRRTSQKSMET